MRTLVICCVTWLTATSAQAEVLGNDLKEYCQFYPQHNESSAMCMGYISGTLDAFRGMNKMLATPAFCEPYGVTGQQLVALTKKTLDEQPQNLHYAAASIILNMMTHAFPCHN